jgi:cysteine synthase A
VEPDNSPILRTGYKVGKHRIQGISDEFIPAIVKLDQLDEIIAVDDGDAIIMSQKLAKLGLGVGISSGANFIAALKAQEKLGKDAVVVTVFSDDNKKYLSTDLMKEEPVKAGFLSTEIELLRFNTANRICEMCQPDATPAGFRR